MSTERNLAWNDFWRRSGNPGDTPAGCLPSQMNPLTKQQCAVWQAFAALVPARASVLDLASGDGRVLGWLRAVRADLTLVGVDLAVQLPPAPEGTTLRSGIAMEALPFSADSMDCVVSQFGVEYADLARAVDEIDRVLRPGGMVALITHRFDGPILAHNLARSGHIRWALDTQRLPEQARLAIAARTMGGAAVPAEISDAPKAGAEAFGPTSAAWEIAEAIRRCLEYGKNDSPDRVSGLIDTIESKARNELARIEALEQACQQTMPPAALTAAMESHGFIESELRPLVSPADPRPFADFRIYHRSA